MKLSLKINIRSITVGLFLFFALGIGQKVPAQQLRYCAQTVSGPNQTDTLLIGLQSLADTAVPIRSLTLSFAFDTVCAQYDTFTTILSADTVWRTFLSRDSVDTGANLMYQGRVYTSRFFYGNADPSFADPKVVFLPPQDQQPLIIMRVLFRGPCSPQVYVENESENPVSQIGSVDNRAIPYRVDGLACAPVGIDDKISTQTVSVYPNPSDGQVQLALPPQSTWQLHDAQGRLCLQGTSKGEQQLDLPHPAGVYLLIVTLSDGRLVHKKLVKW